MAVELPRKIGNYQIISKLGSGGMADVYEALDENLDRRIALKVLPRKYAEDGDRIDRFRREILATAKLVHPNIVTVYDAGSDGEFSYYTMALLPGGELKARIQKGLSHKDISRICIEIASALNYAHEKGFVHRDLKPENILFDEHDNAIVTDLGIAKLVGQSMTATGLSIGTPYYMSPEQARGKSIDGRSDLYSLGVILYRMITKEHLFEAEESLGICMKHIQDPPPPLPDDALIFQPILDKLLAKDPDDRFQNANELKFALEQLNAGIDANDKTQLSQPIGKSAATAERSATENHLKETEVAAAPKKATSPSTSKLPLFLGLGGGALALIAIAVGLMFVLKREPSTEPKTDTAQVEEPTSVVTPSPVQTPASQAVPSVASGEAILQLDSSPSGAEVYLNEQLVGVTPLHSESLPAGTQTFVLRKRYYQDLEVQLELADLKVVKHSTALHKGSGSLSIISEPADAEIVLAGQNIPGRTPLSLDSIEAGEYSLELRKGEALVSLTVHIDHDETTIVRPALKEGELIAYNGQWLSIEQLFELAEQAKANENYIVPEGASALDLYRTILIHSAEDQRALSEIATLLKMAESMLGELIKAKHFDQANSANDKIQELFPEYEHHQSNQELIAAKLEEEEKAKRLAHYTSSTKAIQNAISQQHFFEAEQKLDNLQRNYPQGSLNTQLEQSLEQARKTFANKVESLSGQLVIVGLNDAAPTFQIARTEITEASWKACVNAGACSRSPTISAGDRHPVVDVSYQEVTEEFIPWINRSTGQNFRLPSAAEWQRAYASAGKKYYWGANEREGFANGAQRFGWPNDGYEESSPVGSFKSNGLGLFDMAGNVWEWTQDCDAGNCGRRIILGGSWFSATKYLDGQQVLSAGENTRGKDRGFRLVQDYAVIP